MMYGSEYVAFDRKIDETTNVAEMEILSRLENTKLWISTYLYISKEVV